MKKRVKIDNTDENSFAIGDTIYAAVTTDVDIDGMIFSIEVLNDQLFFHSIII